MSNWDLMMPGMGLTSIGLAGVTVSYSGIAHTFIDGMHALTGLTMFIGLIFLAAGILEGGVSTSNRAKATVLVVASISLAFGMFAFTLNTVSTTATFAGILVGIAFPAIMLAYVITKMPMYARPVGTIFGLAAATGIIAFVAFGLVSPDTYLINEEEDAAEPDVPDAAPAMPDAPIVDISILEGSAISGAPDYDPDSIDVERGSVIRWTNDDSMLHTVTSDGDFGETFDSSLMNAGEVFSLNTATLEPGAYEYICVVHPWMQSSFAIVDGS